MCLVARQEVCAADSVSFGATNGNGNRNKLIIALALVRNLAPVMANKSIRLLFDSWFMRARLILPLLSRNMQVIGQARYDTALFMPPEVPSKSRRGRPRIYGIKITPEAIQRLPATEVRLTLYGKEQLIRLHTVVAVARFLKGVPVRGFGANFTMQTNCAGQEPVCCWQPRLS